MDVSRYVEHEGIKFSQPTSCYGSANMEAIRSNIHIPVLYQSRTILVKGLSSADWNFQKSAFVTYTILFVVGSVLIGDLDSNFLRQILILYEKLVVGAGCYLDQP